MNAVKYIRTPLILNFNNFKLCLAFPIVSLYLFIKKKPFDIRYIITYITVFAKVQDGSQFQKTYTIYA